MDPVRLPSVAVLTDAELQVVLLSAEVAAWSVLLSLLPGEEVVNVDETGHKEKGRRLWTWCFRAELYTLFQIDTSRGSQVIIDTLGEEFDGVLGCDYFSAYRKYMDTFDVRVQFCIAHLIRDVKFLLTLPDRGTQNYGKRLRDAIREMFQAPNPGCAARPMSSHEKIDKPLD